ncbi:MAG: hypothetical protein RIF46_15455 [Cyclobacteriaceae bacterium]
MGTPIISYLQKYPTEFAKSIKSDELLELYSNFAAYELHFLDDYQSEIAEIEQRTKVNYRPYTDSEVINKFLKLTAEKTEANKR